MIGLYTHLLSPCTAVHALCLSQQKPFYPNIFIVSSKNNLQIVRIAIVILSVRLDDPFHLHLYSLRLPIPRKERGKMLFIIRDSSLFGQIALPVIPYPATSSANARVSPFMPNLDPEQCTLLGLPKGPNFKSDVDYLFGRARISCHEPTGAFPDKEAGLTLDHVVRYGTSRQEQSQPMLIRISL